MKIGKNLSRTIGTFSNLGNVPLQTLVSITAG